MIVLNEEFSIVLTISRFVSSGIRNYYILDTGSSDSTIDVMKDFSSRHSLNIIVEKKIFDGLFDYSIARNYCLERSRILFSETNITLMIDSEWYVMNVDKINSICGQIKEECVAPIIVKTSNYDNIMYRFFHKNSNALFEGKVHERVKFKKSCDLSNYLVFCHRPSSKGLNSTISRQERDLLALSQTIDTSSTDLFFYAQTLNNLRRNDEAYDAYEKRTKLDKNDEIYLSYLRMSKIKNRFENLIRAYNFDSTRIEALLELSVVYENSILPLAFFYIEKACKLKYSIRMFSKESYYSFERWKIMSRIADKLKMVNTCLTSSIRCLKHDYDSECATFMNKYFEHFDYTPRWKILNLVLYSENEQYYIDMRKIQEEYFKKYLPSNVTLLFYTYTEGKTEIIDNILYINGSGTILEKTLKAFEYTKNFDYDFVVRSNVSTILNFYNLDLFIRKFDYSGPWIFSHAYNSTCSNLFVSGTCIILSKRFINFLLNSEINSENDDDVEIGRIFLLSKMNIYIPNKKYISENVSEKGHVGYRFKSENRFDDCRRMQLLI